MPKLSASEVDRKNRVSLAYQKMALAGEDLDPEIEGITEIIDIWEIDIEAFICPSPWCDQIHSGELSLKVYRWKGDPIYAFSLEVDRNAVMARITKRQLSAHIKDCQEMLRLME